MRKNSQTVSASAIALALFTVASAVSAAPPAPAAGVPTRDNTADRTAYRIEPNDALEISVVGETELTKTATVLPDGTITYPYIGSFRVVGLTVNDVKRRIAAKLAEQLIDPQVTVSVSKRQDAFVSVLGAVKTPGKVALKEGWRVLDVLAESGGLSVQRMEWATATLVRNGGGEAIPLNLPRLLAEANPKDNPLVSSGDILLINEREASQTQVQVLGEVARQGAYPVPSDGSLVTLLALAGGVTPEAALSRAVIRRGGRDIPVDLTPVDLTPLPLAGKGTPEGAANAASAPPSPRLEPGDTLFIPQNTRRFAFLGAVTRPGAIPYPEGRTINLLEALTLAGGQTPNADMRNVVLLRATPGREATFANAAEPVKAEPIRLDLTAMNRSIGKQIPQGQETKARPDPLHFTLHPGDVVLIPEKGANRLGWRDLLSALPVIGYLRR